MEALKVKAYIERGSDGTYGVYSDPDENRLNYGVIGDGESADEAVKDFYNCYKDMRQSFIEDGQPFIEVEFDIQFDVASFLNYYSRILSLSGLERVTGINQRQLGHYVQGRTRPRPETVRKIENSLHALSSELSQVRLCM